MRLAARPQRADRHGTAWRRPARLGRALLVAAALLAGAAIAALAASPAGARAVHFVRHPRPVPILVYHHVLSTAGPYPLMNVSPWEFAAQLRWLRFHHYQPVTLGTVYDAWTGEGRLPAHPVVLTFDDGYVEQYTTAARMLARYHWPADLCLVVDRGTRLSHAMVVKMIKHGWELVSHTVHNPVLDHLPSARLHYEVARSRRMLERSFHVKVRFFCYPGGDYDRRAVAAVRRAGYEAALGTRYAAAVPRERYVLPRISCYWGESLTAFGQRLRRTVAAVRTGAGPGRDLSLAAGPRTDAGEMGELAAEH